MTTKTNSFVLGQLTMTAQVADQLNNSVNFYRFVFQCLSRHKNGDWGDCCDSDKTNNDLALSEGARILSVYIIPPYVSAAIEGELKIWIITEVDRSNTCVLFPSDY